MLALLVVDVVAIGADLDLLVAGLIFESDVWSMLLLLLLSLLLLMLCW